MKELLKALHNAKMQIKESKLEKKGFNSYSNYHYFLPEQIEKLVFDGCNNNGLYTKFDLLRDELGEVGTLKVYHIETGQVIEFTMATAIPQITATNITQQLGGCVTFTERYLKMTAFGISDNTFDFDSQEPKKETKEKTPEMWLNLFDKKGNKLEAFKNLESEIANGKKFTLDQIRKKYKVSKEVQNQLKEHFNII